MTEGDTPPGARFDLRPARDHGLTPAQRLRSQVREAGLGTLALNGAWRVLTRGYLAAAHRLAVAGRENLPAEPPFVLVANHASHLDALALSSVLRGECARRAFALAAGDHFFTTTGGAAFAAYAVGALPVWRRRTSRRDLETLRARLLEDRLVLILFPEGTRSRDGAMARFQPGLGALIAGTKAPVVPCWIEGAHAAWPATARMPRPRPLRLAIGAPLSFADVPNGRTGWESVTQAAEEAVRALAPSRERGEGPAT
ncbi:lysophospholipid acyltransferase family protein [Roseomonas sp. CCTCC AB2023176]|uniref:lysophospholipid acyltransferase family protein n=1 Tax=Roseomonas sp. CCTCC AB2023176 TaxID=3342640 RepID=UPI0035DB6941